MRGRPPGAARLLLLRTTLASLLLLLPGVALPVDVEEQAPDFTLPSTLGAPISLRQFRGKTHVLLEFYVRDHGPT